MLYSQVPVNRGYMCVNFMSLNAMKFSQYWHIICRKQAYLIMRKLVYLNLVLWEILNRKRPIETSPRYPMKVTISQGYFDKDSKLFLLKEFSRKRVSLNNFPTRLWTINLFSLLIDNSLLSSNQHQQFPPFYQEIFSFFWNIFLYQEQSVVAD